MRQKSRLLFSAFFILVLLAPCLSGCAASPDVNNVNLKEKPFYPDRVVDVRFVMPEENWTYLKENASEEPYVKTDMWYDGELVPDIALRPKGQYSLSSAISHGSIKLPLKADINFFNSARSLYGVKKLNFNNGSRDPSFSCEMLGYELLRQMGIPTPRAAFVDVYVNDIHLGLYTMVEQIDKSFLARYFTDTRGNLYKPEPPAGYLDWTEADIDGAQSSSTNTINTSTDNINIGGGNLNKILKALEKAAPREESANIAAPPPVAMDPGTSGNYLELMRLKTNKNQPKHTSLFHLLEVLNNEPDETSVEEIEKVLDVDEVLRYLAVSVVMVHLDNYIGWGHNYYLHECDGKFSIIPWDLDLAFGGCNFGFKRSGIINYLIDEPTGGAVADRPLIARLLAVPEYLETYHGYISELINGPFSSEVINTRIDELADMIRPYVNADTLKFYPYRDFEFNIGKGFSPDDNPQYMPKDPDYDLKTFVTERIFYIKQQLTGELRSTNNGKGNMIPYFQQR